MMKRIFALLLCAATLLTSLAFVGCDNKDNKKEKEEDKGQYITTYLTDNVYDLDPAKAYTNEALANVVSLMFDTLFKLDEKGKVKKSLVKEYVIEENEAAGEYKMQLYLNDTNWSDGTAVSANDIVFAWKRLLEVDANYEAASLLFDIKNARAAKEGDCSIDDVRIYPAEQQMLEIFFEGKIDYDQFLLNLTSLALAPLRDDIVSKSDDWAKKPGTMVCSGPFKLGRVNMKLGTDPDTEKLFDAYHEYKDANGFDKVGDYFWKQSITDFMLERNIYYYRDYEEDRLKKSVTPYKICVDCSLTEEQLTAMYDAGMVMYISDIPLALRKDGSIAADAVVADKSMSTNSIYLNQNAVIDNGTEEGEKLFANEKVRQALSLAIDRNAIVDAVVYAQAATGLIPTGVFEAGVAKTTFRDACTTSYEYLSTDAAKAASLLSEAGIKPSKYTFQLTVAAYDEVHCAIADVIVANWAALGFNVSVKKLDTIVNNDYYKFTDSTPADICDDLYAEELRAGKFEAILFDYVAFSADAFSVLAPFAKPFSGRGMDMSNPEEYLLTPHITGYDSEAYNTLMEEIFAEKVIANRADKLRQAEGILMTDLPVIPVVFNLNATVTSSKLKGDTTNYYNVTFFQKAKIASYDKYLAAGKAYITDHFSELKFTECNECAYKEFELFKTANTIYSQYFLDEKESK
jgi:ABC-type oligopeptide transport system substrate-binding subunit